MFGWAFLVSGWFGVPYLLIVVPFYFLVRALSSHFLPDPRDLFAITAPLILYIGLSFWRDRQGLNMGYGNVVVAAAVCFGLVLKATTW